MKALSLVLCVLTSALSGCAYGILGTEPKPISGTEYKPKPEAEWTTFEELRHGASRETVLRVAGNPKYSVVIDSNGKGLRGKQLAERKGQTTEFFFWDNGCSARMTRDSALPPETWDKLAETMCRGDRAQWDRIGEGTVLPEVAHYVGVSNNFESVPGGTLYHYKLDAFTRCVVQVSSKDLRVTARKCDSDDVARNQMIETHRARVAQESQARSMQSQLMMMSMQQAQRAPEPAPVYPIQMAPSLPTHRNVHCTTNRMGDTAVTDCN